MDVTDLVQRLLRRWVAALAVVVLAGVAAGVAYVGAGSTEQSTATVVIVPPTLGEAVSEQNPLLNLDNNLAQLATVLASSMSSQEPAERPDLADLVGGGTGAEDGPDSAGTVPGGVVGDATYTISTVTGTNPSFAQLSPQLVFTVTASTPGAAQATSTALVAEAEARLAALQSEVAAPFLARARLVTVVPPTPAETATSGRLRAGGAVGLGVGVLGLLGVLLLDELLTRRATRRGR